MTLIQLFPPEFTGIVTACYALQAFLAVPAKGERGLCIFLPAALLCPCCSCLQVHTQCASASLSGCMGWACWFAEMSVTWMCEGKGLNAATKHCPPFVGIYDQCA